MLFHSTRGRDVQATLSQAIRHGLAPDGGLYMPSAWPHVEPRNEARAVSAVAQELVAPFATGDFLAPMLGELCAEAFSFPVPVVDIDDRFSTLELFHGPTAAFKDVGAQFLAACLTRLPRDRTLDVLVATSGDTGGAVAAAFHRRPGIRVTLLYPRGLVSPTQERQLTCWDDNVVSCAVDGTFDDCQRMVKEAFVAPHLREAFALTSANSINIGRLLPQAAWYAAAALDCVRTHGETLSFIVPSGNLGNAFGALVARHMGYPVGEVVLAHNANRAMPAYLETGEWAPQRSVSTLASAMDVGAPSNMERLMALYPDVTAMRGAVSAWSVDDDAIRRRIRADDRRWGRVWCPHSAVGAEVYARLPLEMRTARRWCVVATAHPAKFPEVVEPLIGCAVDVPESLRALQERPTQVRTVPPTLAGLEEVLNR